MLTCRICSNITNLAICAHTLTEIGIFRLVWHEWSHTAYHCISLNITVYIIMELIHKEHSVGQYGSCQSDDIAKYSDANKMPSCRLER